MNDRKHVHANTHAEPLANLDEIRDCLVLALDQIDTGELDKTGTRHLVRLLHPALELAQGRLQAIS